MNRVLDHGHFARRFGPALAALLVFALLAPTLAHAQPWPQTRGPGWFVGFGIGGGSAGLSSDGESSDREASVGGSFRAGYNFTNELGFGLESNGWSKEMEVDPTLPNATFTLSTGAAALFYYPGASGLMLRGGLGFGSAEATVESGGTSVSVSESGFAFTLGAQYDFRVTRTFSIGPQVDFSWMTLDSFDANYFNGGLSLNWYFVPK